MNQDSIKIWEEGEYTYPLAFGFVPNLTPYLHKDDAARPGLLICPGGGYCAVAPSEGEPVAEKFNELGYNCFVLTYTTNPLLQEPLMEQPVRDLSRAVRFVRANAERFHIIPEQLFVCGFSAAGHLCATLCDYFKEIADENPKYKEISNRPDGAVLAYPVIHSGRYAHRDSFRFLLGADIYERKDEEASRLLDRFSLEYHVDPDTPPCFLWHTATDDLVPLENSTFYAQALREKGIPFAHHIFSAGHHGLSVANERWASRSYGGRYTNEQLERTIQAVKDGSFSMTPERKEEFLSNFCIDMWDKEKDTTYPEVMLWPELADRFLRMICC